MSRAWRCSSRSFSARRALGRPPDAADDRAAGLDVRRRAPPRDRRRTSRPPAPRGAPARRAASRAPARSGARQAWFQPGGPPVLQPQSSRQRPTPWTQLQAVFSTISTSCAGGCARQVLAVVGQPGEAVRLDVVEGVGERHLAVAVVVAVGLAVGRDVHQLVVLRVRGHGGQQAVGEALAARQQPLEGDRPRDRAVVEEDGDPPAAGELHLVGDRGVDPAAAHVLPRLLPLGALQRARARPGGARGS